MSVSLLLHDDALHLCTQTNGVVTCLLQGIELARPHLPEDLHLRPLRALRLLVGDPQDPDRMTPALSVFVVNNLLGIGFVSQLVLVVAGHGALVLISACRAHSSGRTLLFDAR